MTDKIVVLSACPSQEEAAKLGRQLVERRLAACVSLAPGARSIYRWQGAVVETDETLLIIKSSRELFRQLKAELAKMHSYEVPEIIALPVVDGAESYLNWMERELQTANERE
jgi:periplasmic divalent cation tolerance protein